MRRDHRLGAHAGSWMLLLAALLLAVVHGPGCQVTQPKDGVGGDSPGAAETPGEPVEPAVPGVGETTEATPPPESAAPGGEAATSPPATPPAEPQPPSQPPSQPPAGTLDQTAQAPSTPATPPKPPAPPKPPGKQNYRVPARSIDLAGLRPVAIPKDGTYDSVEVNGTPVSRLHILQGGRMVRVEDVGFRRRKWLMEFTRTIDTPLGYFDACRLDTNNDGDLRGELVRKGVWKMDEKGNIVRLR